MSADPPSVRVPPPAFIAAAEVAAVLRALPDARLVGGCVRDSLAGLAVADIDLATPQPPDSVIRAAAAAGLKAVPTGLDHGTVTLVSGGRGFEVTTLRRDVATDGRHATVAFTDDWRADAARRDFTINAMSMTRDGQVFDYFGGVADLHAGRVRFVGDPATRIAEDYLRILRFFRFWARFGRGDPDTPAAAAIAAGVAGLARLSPERVWSELRRILDLPDPSATVRLMDRLGVLAAVIPEGAAPERLARLVARGAPADRMLRLAALLDGPPTAFADRLRLSGAERDLLMALRADDGPPAATDTAGLRRALALAPRPVVEGRLWLAGAEPEILSRLAATETPVFALRGRDLTDAGIPPGPAVGELLESVRGWWLAQGCRGDVRAELARRLAERH